jgi:hypothetical protein
MGWIDQMISIIGTSKIDQLSSVVVGVNTATDSTFQHSRSPRHRAGGQLRLTGPHSRSVRVGLRALLNFGCDRGIVSSMTIPAVRE